MKNIVSWILTICVAIGLFGTPVFASSEPENLLIYVGQQLELKPYLVTQNDMKDGKATWKSYQTSIATVNSAGVVKGLKPGEVIISATIGTGSSIKEARIKLIVKTAVATVNLSETSLRLTVGEEKSISATINPVEEVQAPYLDGVNWKTTSPQVVKVDSKGHITGVSVGKAEVYASSKDGDIRGFCEVEIYNAVQEVVVAPKISVLKIGDGVQLNTSVLPAEAPVKKVIYKSSDVKVAEVSETGYVKAKGGGEALIYVTSVDGGKAVAVNVTVESMVMGIMLDKTYLELDEVNSSYKLIATLMPKHSEEPPIETGIVWKSSNSSIASVDANGLVKALKAGQVEVTATALDGSWKASCTVYSKIQGNGRSIGFSSIKMIEPPKVVYAGQTVKVSYLAYPEEANNRKISSMVSPNKGLTTSIKDGTLTLNPNIPGLYKVTVYSDSASADFTVEVKPSVNGISLEASKLTQYGQGYICYLGQTFDVDAVISLGGIALSELDMAKIKWEYPSGTLKLEKAPNNAQRVSITLLKPGNTYLEASLLDGTVKQRIVLTYEPMAESMEMAEKAEVKLNYQFTPILELKPKKDLRYGYTEVLSKAYDLFVEEAYISTDFIQGEIEFENNNIPELKAVADKLEEGAQKNMIIDEWSRHLLRKNQFELLITQKGSEYQRITSPSLLTDRSLKKLVFFEIKDNGVRSEYSGKALIRVVSHDGNFSKRIWLAAKAQEEDIVLLDGQGNIVATSSDIAKVKLEEKEAETKIQFVASQKSKFKETLEKDLPSAAYLESTWAAVEMKLIEEKQLKGRYQRQMTQADLVELLVKAYTLETKKSFKTVTDRYFTNVKNDAAERAYQLGMIDANPERNFDGWAIITDRQLKDMITKWFKATKTDFKGEVGLQSLIGNQKSYSNEEVIQKLVIIMNGN